MTNPTSLPVIQPQPSSAFYTTANLYLFTSYDRPSYLKAFGVDAPTYDPSRPPKSWFDTSLTGQPGDQVTYHCINTGSPSQAGVTTMTMPVSDASTINLPGVHTYPAYTVAPTDAYVMASGGTQQPFNPTYLATLDEANLIASLWQLPSSAVQEQTLSGPFAIVYPSDESRRQYTIQWKNGSTPLVAALIAQMYANGVGAPGNWDLTANPPKWISTLEDPGAPTLPPRPMPIRPLLQNEAVATTIFGSAIIYRTDLTSVYNPQPAPAEASAGLTADQAATLARIDSNVQTLLRAAGLPLS